MDQVTNEVTMVLHRACLSTCFCRPTSHPDPSSLQCLCHFLARHARRRIHHQFLHRFSPGQTLLPQCLEDFACALPIDLDRNVHDVQDLAPPQVTHIDVYHLVQRLPAEACRKQTSHWCSATALRASGFVVASRKSAATHVCSDVPNCDASCASHGVGPVHVHLIPPCPSTRPAPNRGCGDQSQQGEKRASGRGGAK